MLTKQDILSYQTITMHYLDAKIVLNLCADWLEHERELTRLRSTLKKMASITSSWELLPTFTPEDIEVIRSVRKGQE